MSIALSPTRRRALTAIASATLLALMGCGAPDDPAAESTDAGSGAHLPAPEGDTEYPLTLTTWAGESVLEERPERVAVLGFSPNVDALEAIGATPVYALSDEDWEWRDRGWESGIEVVDTATRKDPINFEGIAAADPDLIVATNGVHDEADFAKLTDIAPVLDNEEQIPGDRIDWRETQRLIGRTLDLGEAAEEAIARAEQEIDAAAEEVGDVSGSTITIAYDYTETGMDYYTVTDGTAEEIVGRLGFAPNPLAEHFVDDAGVSDEQIALLDADMLVVFYNNAADRDAREEMDLFQALPPVEEGRYVSVLSDQADSGGNATWVLRRGASALSLPWAMGAIADWVDEVELP
ncbi:ABC transporter substrate-binding protein [Nocardiopsis sp. MG754419]|uniref:ABC transporter substrate-binding protein n=1 Tax=Nocardiopsis sp. MG754419 TaxID=2259865 RepID=UPI001BAC8BEB|nr:ABC transporter substrate-binding protein [Nocardiopsis sp. MG754419]MBR8743113.1 iron-siderophore ABC transporter substrate-binding protein [Nocardiopsis sp. MG754419]